MARKRTRGRCLCVSSKLYFLSYSDCFTACGLSWFFPPLWVFHVTSCVSTLFLFSVSFFHAYILGVRLWPNALVSKSQQKEGDTTVEEEADSAKADTIKNNHMNKTSTTGKMSQTRGEPSVEGEPSCWTKPTKQFHRVQILWRIRPL